MNALVEPDTAEFENRLQTSILRDSFAKKSVWAMQWVAYILQHLNTALREAPEAMLCLAFEHDGYEPLPKGALSSMTITCSENHVTVEFKAIMPEIRNSEIVVRLACDGEGNVHPLPK